MPVCWRTGRTWTEYFEKREWLTRLCRGCHRYAHLTVFFSHYCGYIHLERSSYAAMYHVIGERFMATFWNFKELFDRYHHLWADFPFCRRNAVKIQNHQLCINQSFFLFFSLKDEVEKTFPTMHLIFKPSLSDLQIQNPQNRCYYSYSFEFLNQANLT